MPAPIARRESAKRLIDQAIRRALADAEGVKTRRALARFLWTVQGRSDLLHPGRYAGRADAEALRRLVLGLLALVGFRREWRRPAEDWSPRGTGPLSLFSSLAHHLMADYPVPPVLLSAWFGGTDWSARRRQRWFGHVGQGGSLRTAGFPLRLSKRMAHEFAQSPPDLSIDFALRRAQVLAIGGSEGLARALASTRLGREFGHDAFWSSLIHLFLNARRLDPAHVEPIVEYLHDQKFEHRRVIIGRDTVVYLEPPRPDLSIKGCTVASLLRRAIEWRARRPSAEPERRLIRWERSAIGEYRREGDEGRAWTIRELLDSDELAAEGKAMRHCVAEYTGSCARRRSTIWSLGLEGPEGRRRVLTIEVAPASRQVLQASRKCNEDPDEASMAILREWAGREGLEVGW